MARSRLDFLDGRGDLRALELLRIAAGPIVVLHLWPFLSRAVDGVLYSDRFYAPYVTWYPEAPRDVYIALLWLAVAATAALSAGALTRVVSAYLAAFVGYNLFLSQTHFSHNRAFLLFVLIGLALLPLGRRWALDAWLRKRRGHSRSSDGPLWPVLLMRFEVVSVFLVSGLSKLIDPDWWGGTVLQLRFIEGRETAADAGLPDWLLDFTSSEGFHTVLGKAAVLTELAIGLGLIFARTRLAAIWLEIAFHVTIEIVFSVQVFSWVALAALMIWVTPKARDRTVVLGRATRASRVLERLVAWLDWTERFRVRHAGDRAPPLQLIDRDGTVMSGRGTARAILMRLPLTFWFVAPTRLLPRLEAAPARAHGFTQLSSADT